MTGVGAVQPGVPLPREGASPVLTEPQDGMSFADWLGARQDRRPFGNGTMHASVDAFAAGGLIAAAPPVVQKVDVVTERVTAAMAEPSDTAAEMATITDRRGPDAVAPVDTADHGGAVAVAVGSKRDAQAVSLATLRGGSSASRVTPVAFPRVATMLPEADATEPVSRPAPRPARERATATLTVRLDDDAAGAVVAVSGDVAPGDEDALLRAVTRLLAQHGLSLDELRVAGRPAHDGQGHDRQEQGKR